MPHEEVGFLTMYLAGSLERSRLRPKVRITVVCPAGMATAWILVSRLSAEFPNVEITRVVVVHRGPEQTAQISEWRTRVRMLSNLPELRDYSWIEIRTKAFVDHRLPRDGAEVLRQHLGSVFIMRCATSTVS